MSDEPDIIFAGWPPDPDVVKHYKGRNVKFVTAKEFYDLNRRLAEQGRSATK